MPKNDPTDPTGTADDSASAGPHIENRQSPDQTQDLDDNGLFPLEAALLERIQGDSDVDTETLVRRIKDQRVGPAAAIDPSEPIPEPLVPGGHVGPPVVNRDLTQPEQETKTGVTQAEAAQFPEVPPAELTPQRLAGLPEPGGPIDEVAALTAEAEDELDDQADAEGRDVTPEERAQAEFDAEAKAAASASKTAAKRKGS